MSSRQQSQSAQVQHGASINTQLAGMLLSLICRDTHPDTSAERETHLAAQGEPEPWLAAE